MITKWNEKWKGMGQGDHSHGSKRILQQGLGSSPRRSWEEHHQCNKPFAIFYNDFLM